MAQIEKDTLCKYCYGCVALENNNFIGARNCKNFVPAYNNWREMYEGALQNKFKNKKQTQVRKM